MNTYSTESYFQVPGLPLWVNYGSQGASVPVHNHDFIEIVFVAQGYAVHNFIDRGGKEHTYGLIQGDVFSVMPEERHGYDNGRNLVIYNVGITPDFIAGELHELERMSAWHALSQRTVSKVHLTLNDREAAERCLKRIIHECLLRKPGFKLYAKAALLEFLLIVSRVNPTELQTSIATAGGILETIRLMEKSPEKAVSLAYLARNAAMSVSHYTKKFREATGVSPLAYLINLRLEKARAMLEDTTLPVAEIAFQCGFCDSNYMIRLFRRRHGITPARYRG